MQAENPDHPTVAILDYGMGNLHSVYRAFLEVGASAEIIEEPAQAEAYQALVFPGQGAIVDTMRLLKERRWDSFIREWISADQPFFGICLGLQALFEFSEEGDTHGLGVFPGRVRRFRFPVETGFKIPHMGWNSVAFGDSRQDLLKGIEPRQRQFYFVHSYYVSPEDPHLSWASTEYGGIRFCSGIASGKLVATQFHPEKSQANGLQLYRNFIQSLTPR